MYHIDYAFNDKNVLEPVDPPINSNNGDFLFESLIINKIHENHCNKSGCLFSSPSENYTPLDKRSIAEANCNGLLGCHFCELASEIKNEILPGEFVIIKFEDNFEIAQIKLIGEIVKLKRQSFGLFDEELPVAIRKATNEDIDKYRKNFNDEIRAVPIFRQAISKHNLLMKLVSIHFQFDRKKLFFFYTADGRIDFRELAKDLAAEFKTRIELRQIGVRDEAKKVGGMGTCGREYCCIAFLSSFKKITTQLANEQNLLSNMGKLSGPCGKLKCCLSFEME